MTSYYVHATDIVGYTFQAANHCVECTRELAINEGLKAGGAIVWGDSGTAEQVLDEWASLIGVDPDADNDTGVFPMVVFAGDVEDAERCDGCGTLLIEG